MSATAQALHQFIRENFLFGAETPLGDDDSLLGLGVIDSTGVLELVDFLQRQFGIRVADEELTPENLDSVSNLVRYLEAKRATKALV